MAARERNFPDTVRDNFSAVTGQTHDFTELNIEGLRAKQAKTIYFSRRIARLPWAHIPDDNENFSHKDFTERITYIAGGSYGKVFQGVTSGKAYKKMTMRPSYNTEALRELYYREIYLEAFIQTLLQNDPSYGINIAAIEKIYKDQMPNGSSRNIFYYQMETIPSPNSVGNYLRSQIDPVTPLVPRAALSVLLVKLATILQYFRTTYGFYHCDLHTANVLLPVVAGGDLHTANVLLPVVAGGDLPGGRTIKLIDFGKACVKSTSTSKTFSVKNESCKSRDLFIFICSLYKSYGDILDVESIAFLNSLFSLPTGENLYEIMNQYVLTRERIPIFYLAYRNRINNKSDPFWGEKIVGVSRFEKFRIVLERFYPDNFLTFATAAAATAAAAAAAAATAATAATAARAAAADRATAARAAAGRAAAAAAAAAYRAAAFGSWMFNEDKAFRHASSTRRRKNRKHNKQKSRRRR